MYTIVHSSSLYHCTNIKSHCIRASVDALCRDEQGQISRDPRTKRLLNSARKPS